MSVVGVYADEDFNPHSREGRDKTRGCPTIGSAVISIHTPAKGVTQQDKTNKFNATISIHTPAKGVTL